MALLIIQEYAGADVAEWLGYVFVEMYNAVIDVVRCCLWPIDNEGFGCCVWPIVMLLCCFITNNIMALGTCWCH